MTEEEIFEILKDDQRLEAFLSSLSGEDIKRMLIYLNSKLRGISVEEGGIYEGNMYAGTLISPKTEIQEKYFDKMAELLRNVKGRQYKATIMYYLINQLHLFYDGNGRTSRCVYELLANKDFDINNDYFSHDEKDRAKIQGTQFERDKKMLRTEYAGVHSSYFLYRYLMALGLINSNEDITERLGIKTINDAGGGNYCDVFISENAQEDLTVETMKLVAKALLDNNENYSVGALTMLVMLKAKGNNSSLREFYFGGDLDKVEGYIPRTLMWIDNTEDRDVSAKSMGDWTSEDYLLSINVADLIKESMLDVYIDIFEHPESFVLGEGQTVAQVLTNYEYPINKHGYPYFDSETESIKLHQSPFSIDRDTRTYKHMEELSKLLGKTISLPMPIDVATLGKQSLNAQQDTFAKLSVEETMRNAERSQERTGDSIAR